MATNYRVPLHFKRYPRFKTSCIRTCFAAEERGGGTAPGGGMAEALTQSWGGARERLTSAVSVTLPVARRPRVETDGRCSGSDGGAWTEQSRL